MAAHAREAAPEGAKGANIEIDGNKPQVSKQKTLPKKVGDLVGMVQVWESLSMTFTY